LIHEIESAYECEWEILKLPGKITGFLLMHIPIIIIMLWGVLEIEKFSAIGVGLGLLMGLGGLAPFLVHKVFVKREQHFNLPISNIVIYGNVLTGLLLLVLIAFRLA
ncbi:MAG: hypothetical protein JXO44_06345, partial [Clostridia bacterium]|nr:hypothetical protein [Clostridia bacterium]